MTRYRDWQSRLQAAIDERQHRPFAWGSQDCCLFVCDCVLAMTGHDPAEDLRGYGDERGAVRLVQQLGGVRAIAAARLGAEILPALAQLGDVGLVVTGGRESLALWGGSMWHAPAADGLTVLPPAAALVAWRAC